MRGPSTLATSRDHALRALVVFDEIYGFLPPHPANPPTKRPMVALMKQARAFGIGVVVATQNPMDLDYRALSNAGLWCVGRLHTDADRARVIEALVGNGSGVDEDDVRDRVKRLGPRWFVLRDVHASGAPVLLETRAAMSWLRGPGINESEPLFRGPPGFNRRDRGRGGNRGTRDCLAGKGLGVFAG